MQEHDYELVRRPDEDDNEVGPEVADAGANLERPWILGFLTAAAPYTPTVGIARSTELMRSRIRRILSVAGARGVTALVLGAWGCGAFGNDPRLVAQEFRMAREHTFDGAFQHVVFAITDWSPERRFLAPFREVFNADAS